jgi:hypothetical protein
MDTSRLRTPPAPASPGPVWHPAPLSRHAKNYKKPKKFQGGRGKFLGLEAPTLAEPVSALIFDEQVWIMPTAPTWQPAADHSQLPF